MLGLAALLSLVAGLWGGAESVSASLEYRVKLAFLLNFPKFIEWPAPRAEPEPPPFSVCVIGEDPFGEDLDRVVQGRTVQNRAIVVKRLDEATRPLPLCNILFASPSVRRRLGDVLAAVDNAPTLTVGEVEEFTNAGGCLRFFIADRKVRFEINLDAADRAGLKISALLLNLAVVTRKPAPRPR